MHNRPTTLKLVPDDPEGGEHARRRPLTPAERQRKKRKLDSGGFDRVTTRYSETVTAALFWQAIDANLSEEEATAASTDKAKIAEGLANVIEHWAQGYLSERDRP